MRRMKLILAVCLACLGILVIMYSSINSSKAVRRYWTSGLRLPSSRASHSKVKTSIPPTSPTWTTYSEDFTMSSRITDTYNMTTTLTEDSIESKNSSLLIDTEGCKILDVDPFDPRLKVFYSKQSPYVFKRNIFSDLIYLKNNKIILNLTAKWKVLEHYKVQDPRMLTCCVSYFKIFAVEKTDNEVRFPYWCKFFYSSIIIEGEYMKINCFIGTQKVYEKFDVKIGRKSNVEARCRNILQNAEEKGMKCHDQLSVMIMGIDSVSRLNFHRQLPETRKYLMEELGAIEFLGYNKAGEYTFVCLMPLLSGMLTVELSKQCGGDNKHFFDKCRILFDVFAAAGYRTAFVEDMNEYGLFTYVKKGFQRQPTDYYGRTFFNAYDAPTAKGVTRAWRNVPFDEAVFQWAMEFQKEFQNELHFGHFWISYFSHDTSNTAQWIDPFLSKNLWTLKNNKMLNNTLLILMSDHGMRFGALRATDIGRFEAKLPSAFFVFPEWFKQKYPKAMENFRRNAQNRFTTAFDMHRTLEDLAKCKIPHTSEPQVARGTNLFSNISPKRTCNDAGIGDSFCACLRRQFEVDLSSELSFNLTTLVYFELVSIASERPDICAPLMFKNLTSIKGESDLSDGFNVNSNQSAVFTVTFFTEPGDGNFEGTVLYNGTLKTYSADPNIRRINRYGDTSSCVTDNPKLKPICYCINQEEHAKPKRQY